jgi:hypothetical protein
MELASAPALPLKYRKKKPVDKRTATHIKIHLILTVRRRTKRLLQIRPHRRILYQQTNQVLMHIEKVLVKLVRIRRGAEVEEELCEVGARGDGGVGREEVACGFVEDDGAVE